MPEASREGAVSGRCHPRAQREGGALRVLARISLWGVGVLLLACTRSGGPAQRPAAAWTDPSLHRVSFVSVAPDVRLEVLDWGGSGPPLVFLSGLQDVAHGFDDLAPEFTN